MKKLLMLLALSSPAFAGYGFINAMPASSYATNAAMGATLSDGLATLKVNAKTGAMIMRAVAKSSAVRMLGRSALYAAPILMADQLGLFDEDAPMVLLGGNGRAVQLSGPEMDSSVRPQLAFPQGGWMAVINQIGYPAERVYGGYCAGGDCARFIRTFQWACPETGILCKLPSGVIDDHGYTVQSGLGIGNAGSPPIYQYILVAEKLPPRLLRDIQYQPSPLYSGKDVAAALPDSRVKSQVNPALIASVLQAATKDAQANYPGIEWPAGLVDALDVAAVRRAAVPVTVADALAPGAIDPMMQWPPGWADARPSSVYWDPTAPTPSPTPGTGTGTTPGTGTGTGTGTGSNTGPIDLGQAPLVPEPMLADTPSGMAIMQPVITALNPMRGLTLPSGAGQCPTVTLDLSIIKEGGSHVLSEHCDLLESARPIIAIACAAAWALSALFIVLRA
ncbi:hypothetical protein [Chromobacterium sp. IIBBL 290-4]|uniref:hypothetical protein n=1 Tax=Chromobacterium sp. IIBBL 290-4 TaxID=2953890 RepID=UPI0020B878DA|nr:hypothetical protein [Chromobacterium sp. IIBBL 290-4]UTH73583.1 hypothetical protein NKT35_18880 [Chromobacterium sp. IIBBL 290-4]